MQSVTDQPRDASSGNDHPLIKALRGVPVNTSLGPEAVERLTPAADHHGVVIPVYRALMRSERASVASSHLAKLAKRRRAGALVITMSAVDVCNWLQHAEIRHAVLKGPAVAVAYPEADREFFDLDVLVAPHQLQQAISALEDHGATTAEDVPWPRPDGIGEVSLRLAVGVTLDLHGDLIHHADVRQAFRLPVEPLLERATTACILGQELAVLDPEDTLVHVAMHAMISGGDRLVWLADLDALVRQDQLSWTTLVSRAQEARAALVVAVMLDRAVCVLGTPVPPPALRALQRRGVGWALLLRTFEHWRPTARNYGHRLHGQVLMRATRDSTMTSLATLIRLIWTDVIKFALRDPHHPWRAHLRQTWRRK